ncbi:MAG: DEAD/DEAH box helicase [Archangiaceae bacterium]|nr:DEAD/DEAH box helicase [Archangiaceae bacterium]
MPDTPQKPFSELGLPAPLLSALTTLGYEKPTPVQGAAIPVLLEGRDVLAQAATGTGKTAAFSLPMLALLAPDRKRAPFAPAGLVLVPTRELALQVTEAMRGYGSALGVHVTPVYGGEPIGTQLKALKRGVDVVVATPGRALDHLDRGTLVLSGVKLVVLDEADEMLDMGFAEDLEKILSGLPKKRQTALFSATLPSRIQKIAEGHLQSPVRLSIARPKAAAGELPKVRQVAYVVQRQHKVAALVRVLQAEDAKSALVFCRTRDDVDELAALLPEKGLSAEALHGGLDQSQRDRVMKRFRSGAVRLLIATDVAARGLDIDHLALVVNYEAPTSAEIYVHRIGRTGRAGREGVAITLIEASQQRFLKSLERAGAGAITVAQVPSAQQLEQQRLERTKAMVLEAARNSVGAELKAWLAEAGIDVAELGAAAVMLLHREHFGSAEIETADIPTPRRSAPKARADSPRGAPQRPGSSHRPPREGAPSPEGKVMLFVSLGTEAGVRPADLVGAFANEAGLSSRDIGPIQIQHRFALVGVPAERAETVIKALRQTTIRGRKAMVRRDRDT